MCMFSIISLENLIAKSFLIILQKYCALPIPILFVKLVFLLGANGVDTFTAKRGCLYCCLGHCLQQNECFHPSWLNLGM